MYCLMQVYGLVKEIETAVAYFLTICVTLLFEIRYDETKQNCALFQTVARKWHCPKMLDFVHDNIWTIFGCNMYCCKRVVTHARS